MRHKVPSAEALGCAWAHPMCIICDFSEWWCWRAALMSNQKCSMNTSPMLFFCAQMWLYIVSLLPSLKHQDGHVQLIKSVLSSCIPHTWLDTLQCNKLIKNFSHSFIFKFFNNNLLICKTETLVT